MSDVLLGLLDSEDEDTTVLQNGLQQHRYDNLWCHIVDLYVAFPFILNTV